MTRIEEERIDEMLAGLEGVTPGPWETQGTEWEGDERGSNFIVGSRQQGLIGAAHALPTEFVSGEFERVDANAAHIARCDPDTIRSLLLELKELRAQGGVRVKGLEWLSDGDSGFVATAVFGEYEINPVGFLDQEQWELFIPAEHLGHFDTVEEAKAAAEADYRTRILSALETEAVEPEELDGRVEIIEQSDTMDGGTALTLRLDEQEAVVVVNFGATSLPPIPTVTGWQPIETAPKDGTHVLLFWPNIPAGIKSLKSTSKATGISVGWYETSEHGVGFMSEGDFTVPVNQEDCTHWMPLPSPPALSEESKP